MQYTIHSFAAIMCFRQVMPQESQRHQLTGECLGAKTQMNHYCDLLNTPHSHAGFTAARVDDIKHKTGKESLAYIVLDEEHYQSVESALVGLICTLKNWQLQISMLQSNNYDPAKIYAFQAVASLIHLT